MQRYCHVKALLLLAVFVAGGVLGPAMHYAEHASDAADSGASHERVHSAAADVAGGSTWAGEADHLAVDGGALCRLCHFAKTGADTAAVSALDRQTVRVATLTPAQSRVAGRQASHVFVRGPPIPS